MKKSFLIVLVFLGGFSFANAALKKSDRMAYTMTDLAVNQLISIDANSGKIGDLVGVITAKNAISLNQRLQYARLICENVGEMTNSTLTIQELMRVNVIDVAIPDELSFLTNLVASVTNNFCGFEEVVGSDEYPWLLEQIKKIREMTYMLKKNLERSLR